LIVARGRFATHIGPGALGGLRVAACYRSSGAIALGCTVASVRRVEASA
jgi:hypothetical protein